MEILKNKTILLAVTSSIAIYRACDLVRLLMSLGARVQVVMSPNATKLVSPQVFRSLSGHPVKVGLFGDEETYGHIALAQTCDLMLVAPATANFLGKAANGIGDDALTTSFITMPSDRVIIAPAMNYRMYENPVVKQNIKNLSDFGYRVLGTDYGALACGEIGKGRFAHLDDIVEECRLLLSHKLLDGKKVLVTAGPTQEPLDPVRYLTNRSSGKMGYAIAAAARRAGAEVTLISGPGQIREPYLVEVIKVQTAKQMEASVKKHITDCDCFVSAAAVSDFRPLETKTAKIKKQKGSDYSLELKLNPDILLEVAEHKKQGQIIVGFALESEDLLQTAMKKLEAKSMDLIVANSVDALGTDQSQAILMDTKGVVEQLPMQSKDEIAFRIIEEMSRLVKPPQTISSKKSKK